MYGVPTTKESKLLMASISSVGLAEFDDRSTVPAIVPGSSSRLTWAEEKRVQPASEMISSFTAITLSNALRSTFKKDITGSIGDAANAVVENSATDVNARMMGLSA